MRRYEILELKVIHRRRRTGFEETKDFPIRVDDLIAGRYQAGPHACTPAFKPAMHRVYDRQESHRRGQGHLYFVAHLGCTERSDLP